MLFQFFSNEPLFLKKCLLKVNYNLEFVTILTVTDP